MHLLGRAAEITTPSTNFLWYCRDILAREPAYTSVSGFWVWKLNQIWKRGKMSLHWGGCIQPFNYPSIFCFGFECWVTHMLAVHLTCLCRYHSPLTSHSSCVLKDRDFSFVFKQMGNSGLTGMSGPTSARSELHCCWCYFSIPRGSTFSQSGTLPWSGRMLKVENLNTSRTLLLL